VLGRAVAGYEVGKLINRDVAWIDRCCK